MSSVDSYYSDLKVFIGWFHMQERPKDPDAFRDESISLAELAQIRKTDVYEYLTWLMRDRHLGATTRARRLAVIRSFFHYLTVATNQLDMDPTLGVEPPKRKKSLPVYLDIQQAETLLEAPAGAFELRDRTILMLFLTCGLRISELAALDLDSVNKERVRILGKGNKERIHWVGDNSISSNCIFPYCSKERWSCFKVHMRFFCKVGPPFPDFLSINGSVPDRPSKHHYTDFPLKVNLECVTIGKETLLIEKGGRCREHFSAFLLSGGGGISKLRAGGAVAPCDAPGCQPADPVP